MIVRATSVFLLCGLLLGVARADDQRDQEARRLFKAGAEAFDKHEFQAAYDAFEKSYVISQRPELLFNMSSALKELGRPHDAAHSYDGNLYQIDIATGNSVKIATGGPGEGMIATDGKYVYDASAADLYRVPVNGDGTFASYKYVIGTNLPGLHNLVGVQVDADAVYLATGSDVFKIRK